MIPTSIDGTDITGATIDGTDVQEITVDGQTVFTAGPTIVDDFEDNNLNEYNFMVGPTPSVNSSIPKIGSFCLQQPSGSSFGKISSFPGDGLANYISPGNDFSYYVRTDGDIRATFAFNVDSDAGTAKTFNGMLITFVADQNFFGLFDEVGSTDDFASPSINQNQWYKVEVTNQSGDVDVELYDGTSLLTTVSLNSTSPTGSGIGFISDNRNASANAFFDQIIYE